MKRILITMKPKEGNFGGAMAFVRSFVRYLDELKEFEVVYDFTGPIDIILIIDPRLNSSNNIPIDVIEKYKIKNPNVFIVHRVNECDIKRTVSIEIEKLLLRAMKISTVVIFVSKWLRNYFLSKYMLKNIDARVIINGCDRRIYFPSRFPTSRGKVKIVTHHWSKDYMKGFGAYNLVDNIIEQKELDIEFIFIGRYIDNYSPRNIKIISPRYGNTAADVLRTCDIYITGTQNEPGGMHYVEALSCGLPVLYSIGGGGVDEVCRQYGFEFKDKRTLIKGIDFLFNHKDEIRTKIDYKYLGSNRCCIEYLDVLREITVTPKV